MYSSHKCKMQSLSRCIPSEISISFLTNVVSGALLGIDQSKLFRGSRVPSKIPQSISKRDRGLEVAKCPDAVDDCST